MAKNTFSVKNDMQYLFKPKVSLSKIERKKKRRAWAFAIGSVLVLIQLVLTVLFLLKMFKLDILPFKYLFMINIILILLVLYDFTSQFTKSHILGKLISVMLSCLILFTYLFAAKFDSVLDKLGAANVEIDIVDVCVLSNDKAQNLNDAANYKFAINSTASNANINTSIESISSETGKTIKPTEYTNWSNLVNALYDNKNVKAIVINHSMMSIISQEFPDFEDSIKIIKTYEYKEKVELDASNVNVKRDPFIIYVSGISSDDGEDTKLASKALSDVNILAVINPETKQVLLVTTPRDSYIKISNSSDVTGYDKLAHAGYYGVDKSIEALENLYGINIDYYVKINFAGSQAVIDALGGITIESEIEFTNGWEAAPVSYHFVQGANECDGEKAIAFARERKAFAAGDFQRGRNQTAVIKGIIQKATSPAILTRYSAVMDTVSDMFLTNIPSSAISDLVKLQLSNSTPWNIQTYSISGKTDEYRHLEVSNVYGASIVLPYEEDISTATKLMNKVIAGETFDVDTYLNSDN
ncbi:MAG: hypothetical protein HP026_03925 [Lachnospira sp.]|nr:hypothetical protein [Lachnospira sp.]